MQMLVIQDLNGAMTSPAQRFVVWSVRILRDSRPHALPDAAPKCIPSSEASQPTLRQHRAWVTLVHLVCTAWEVAETVKV
jgi:hypothetical protein